MADQEKDTKPEDKGDDPLGGISDDEQKKLLDDPDDEGDGKGTEQLGDAGKRALDRIRQREREAREARNVAIKERDELRAWRKQQEDKDKTELERATGERDTYRSRAEAAEARIARRELAEELAPEHATAKQIAQVAKRMQGEGDAALRKDAEELFELIAPAPSGNGTRKTTGTPPPGAPKERLKGGADPDDSDPGEMDPYKLAALVKRRR